MRLVTLKSGQGWKLGIKTEAGILDVAAAAAKLHTAHVPITFAEVWQAGEGVVSCLSDLADRAAQAAPECWLDERELKIGPCVPNPGKIICVGQNYRAHVDEYTIGSFETPVLFNKFNNAIAADGEEIPIPKGSAQVDYEAELAVVIGRRARQVGRDEALGYVFGYCNANDLSARDLQFRTVQWLLGKSPDGFCPIGPYLVTRDEVPDPQQLEIRCTLNGEVRQQANTRQMIFDVAFLVSYISQVITLEPGDVILTGTPEGTILGYPKEEQVWMKDGDEVCVEVQGLGVLTNRLVHRG